MYKLWTSLAALFVVFHLHECIAGMDKYQHFSNKTKIVDDSLALTEFCPDMKFHVYWYYSY